MESVTSKIHQLWVSSLFNNVQNFRDISKMQKKNREKVFLFGDDCIWVGCFKLSILRRKYLWQVVDMLKNSPKILSISKRNFYELNCLHSDQWIWQKWCHSDFSTVWSHLLCCLSKGPLKRDFLDICLTTFFGIHNFRNTSAMRVIFILEISKI